MRRSGFTVVELLVVMVIIGVAAAMAVPKLNSAARNESVRGALREVTSQLARARSMAVQRGCRSALQLRQATSEVWVEVCKVTGTGRDTIGGIQSLAAKYSVTMTTSADSIPFGPSSLGLAPAALNLTFTRSGYSLPLTISAVGKPSW